MLAIILGFILFLVFVGAGVTLHDLERAKQIRIDIMVEDKATESLNQLSKSFNEFSIAISRLNVVFLDFSRDIEQFEIRDFTNK